MKKNKLWFSPFLIVIITTLLFLVSQIPTANSSIKNLPVGIVNSDEGAIGDILESKIINQSPDTIKLISFKNTKSLKEAMDSHELYAGIVIPEKFTSEFNKIKKWEQTNPIVLRYYLNEGENASISSLAPSIFDNFTEEINKSIRNVLLNELNDGSSIPNSSIAVFGNPITHEIVKINPTKSLNTAPISLFPGIWFSSLIAATLMYLAGNHYLKYSKKDESNILLKNTVLQTILPIMFGFFSSFLVVSLSKTILKFNYDNTFAVFLFISICSFSLVYLFIAFYHLFKIGSFMILGFMVFFCLPLVQFAPEMIPTFYRDWVLPWLPIRFLTEGLKEVLFFSGEWLNINSFKMLIFGSVSLLIIWGKFFFVTKKKRTN